MRDLIITDLRYRDRSGEIYLVQESPHHRWAYFSEMDRHEALVFKQYDSQVSGVARFTPTRLSTSPTSARCTAEAEHRDPLPGDLWLIHVQRPRRVSRPHLEALSDDQSDRFIGYIASD